MIGVALTAALALMFGGHATRIVAPGLRVGAKAHGEAIFHVELDASGKPHRIAAIVDIPPCGAQLREAVSKWRLPALATSEEGRHVFVVAVFEPPTLLEPRLFPPPPAASIAPPMLPFPVKWERPPYPPRAHGDGVAVVEARIADDGVVEGVTLVSSAAGFDGAALAAAARWRFRPAYRDGRPVRAVAFLVFGFPSPWPPKSARHR